MFKNKVKIIKFFPVSFLLIVLLFILNFLLFPAERVLAAGNTTGYAWSQEGGWIDFNPTGGGVTVSDTKLTGYAWGDEAGWINFDCAATPGECPNNTQKVINDGSGGLSGYAWGAEIGWIDFKPVSSQVIINGATGSFSGYAWSDEFGWISFEAADGANVNTTWRLNNPPIAGASADGKCDNSPIYPPGTSISLTTDNPACPSFDPDGKIKTFEWDRTSDGDYEVMCAGASCTTAYIYDAASVATLKVTDNDGDTATDTVSINICIVACTTDAECDDSEPLTKDICLIDLADPCNNQCSYTPIISIKFWREILPKFQM